MCFSIAALSLPVQPAMIAVEIAVVRGVLPAPVTKLKTRFAALIVYAFLSVLPGIRDSKKPRSGTGSPLRCQMLNLALFAAASGLVDSQLCALGNLELRQTDFLPQVQCLHHDFLRRQREGTGVHLERCI